MIDLEELERLAKKATPGPWCRQNRLFKFRDKKPEEREVLDADRS